jgi:hypothetical protein
VVEEDPGLEAARAAKRKALRLFEGLAAVCGAGVAMEDGRYVVRLNLEAEPEPAVELPSEVDGVPITIQVIGTPRAQ